MSIRRIVLICLFFFISEILGNGLVQTEVILQQQSKMLMSEEGGNSSSIGGDSIDRRHLSAWFYGKRPIRTCYHISDHFGVTEKKVSQFVFETISKWQKYFKEKEISRSESRGINTNFNFIGRCQGDTDDLRLHFGTGPIFWNLHDLVAVQKLYRPIAYVNKRYMTKDLTWGRGYIRFIPEAYYKQGKSPFPSWKNDNNLKAMLLHEFGHVLGFIHSEGTIMDPNITSHLFFKNKKRSDKKIINIDQTRELLTCLTCHSSYVLYDNKENLFKIFPKLKNGKVFLEKKGMNFELGNKSNKYKIKIISQIYENDKNVIESNFTETRGKQKMFILSGHIGDLKESLLLYYNLKDSGRVSLNIVKDNEVVELGVFK